MNDLTHLYYKFTAHIPRKLPRTPAEFSNLRRIMIEAYGCNDQPSTTMVLAGQVTSTEAHKIRKSYGHMANCIKRLEINAIAAEFKQKAIQENNERFEAATKRAVDAFNAEEAKNDESTKEQQTTDAEPQPQESEETQTHGENAVPAPS